MKNFFLTTILLISTFFAFSQAGQLDVSFDPGSGPGNYVWTSSLQTDGKIIIGGDFTTYAGVSRNYVARINSDGSLDPTFNIGTGALGAVLATAIQADGKVLVGGYFTSFNGTIINRIVRLNTNGSVDASFAVGTGASGGPVNNITVQPDGKIIVAGQFTSFNGTAVQRVIRLNSNGTTDATFSCSVSEGAVMDVALLSDGKIVIAGNFFTVNGTSRNRIARLNANGSIDAVFDPGVGVNDMIRTVSVQTDGKVVIGGAFYELNGVPVGSVARLNTNGTPDASFVTGEGPSNHLYSSVIQPDGKIIIGGSFLSFSGVPTGAVTRLNTNGSLDASWNAGTGASADVFSTTLQPDGKLIIGGVFGAYNGTLRSYLARIGICGTISLGQSVTHNSCFGDSEGAIDVTLTGGSGSNTYNWTDGATTEDRTDLPAGTYTLTASDINGCSSQSTSFVITQPQQITSSFSASSCSGSYVWNSQTYTTGGSYQHTYTSINTGCDSIVTMNLMLHETPVVNVTSVNDITLQADAAGTVSYQWINCATNQPVSGATSPLFTATQNGSYAVLVNNGNCTDTSACIAIVRVGINETALPVVNIYPNPASGQVNIAFEEYTEGTVRLFDITGNLIHESEILTEKTLVIALGQAPGVYLVEVSTKQASQLFRVVKEN